MWGDIPGLLVTQIMLQSRILPPQRRLRTKPSKESGASGRENVRAGGGKETVGDEGGTGGDVSTEMEHPEEKMSELEEARRP